MITTSRHNAVGPSAPVARNTRYLDAAAALGNRLCRDAVWAGARCNWLGDAYQEVSGEWRVVHRALGPQLYSGSAGVALFLSSLFQHTGDRIHARVARGAARHALSRAEHEVHPGSRIGFFTGLTGIAHTLLEIDERVDAPELGEGAHDLLRRACAENPLHQGLDVISGCAGAIPALLDIQERGLAEHAYEYAVLLGERILSAAHDGAHGSSWDTGIGASAHLTGFSHGASGIAWSLLELYRVTGDERLADAARRGFEYEHTCYNSTLENWPDYRLSSSRGRTPGYGAGWCHGAPGIALSRLRACEILAGYRYQADAEPALRTTRAHLQRWLETRAKDCTYCHGATGLAEVLLYADQVAGAKQHESLVTAVAEALATHAETDEAWPCGVPGGGETPGLMTGLSGVGYFLLRQHAPTLVSVLLPVLRAPH